ncbi:hypothetical protein FQA39_LY18517 [Lamprigera yunnana]|nr:hypothetical protein FQA39_LY18517 [Lamprigera yunnana]
MSPTLSVGASLIARGHEVKWFGITPLDSKHIPEGGSIFTREDLIPYQEEIARILKRQDDGPACSGPEVDEISTGRNFQEGFPSVISLKVSPEPMSEYIDMLLHEETALYGLPSREGRAYKDGNDATQQGF